MSKREQAAQDFTRLVNSRTRAALVTYFNSHGVWVEDAYLENALMLADYQSFLRTLTVPLGITAKAANLASDLGTISLAEKEKAMRAVYEVEERCAEALGKKGELRKQASSLYDAVAAWPQAPAFGMSLTAAAFGCVLILFDLPIAGLLIIAAAILLGAYKVVAHERKRQDAAVRLAQINEQFDALLTIEVTPRPAVPTERDRTRVKAYALALLTVCGTIGGLAYHYEAREKSRVGTLAATSTEQVPSTLADSKPTSPADKTSQRHLGWLLGKYPSEVTGDRRFRTAFNHVTPADWREISERLVVTSGAIQSSNGFLYATGCMARQCGSDDAAFAINEATGKGNIIFRKNIGATDGTAATKVFAWKDMPVSDTPLAEWARTHSTLLQTSVTPMPATSKVNFKTSFDCSNVRSDAERLICGDAELADADRSLASTYAQAKAAAIDQSAFRERTRSQWNFRNQTCHDRECLQRWYVDQNIALQEIAETGRADVH